VKQGRHCRIPEGPHDLRRLWSEATPFAGRDLPEWLAAEDAADYRCLGSLSLAGLSAVERDRADEELGELELARLIVDTDSHDDNILHLAIGRPRVEPVWSIGIHEGDAPWSLSDRPHENPVLTAASVTDVPATSVADPFLMRRDGRWFMFFEVVNWRTWKGEIGLATSSDGLTWRYEQIVLTEPFHLSYPYVFEADDGIYMIPETSQTEAVRLYRATRFPTEWEYVGDLLQGRPFADASVVRHQDRWWLFAETSGDRNDTLRLYHADALAGSWQEHPQSPVIQGDAENARPAGRIIAADGHLFRFAQNCRTAYGTDVRVREIMRLTTTEFVERPLGTGPVLGPTRTGWNAGGMHHVDPLPLAHSRWLAAVDGWRMDDEADAP